MEKLIEYLKAKNPNSEIWQPVHDTNYIYVRTKTFEAKFGKNDSNEDVIVGFYKTDKYHFDTIKLLMLKEK